MVRIPAISKCAAAAASIIAIAGIVHSPVMGDGQGKRVFAVNGGTDLGGNTGKPFDTNALYWAAQELGLVGPNGEFPHEDPDNEGSLIYVNDAGEKTVVGTVGKDPKTGAVWWTNGDGDQLFTMTLWDDPLDPAWEAVKGGTAGKPNTLIIACHGDTDRSKPGVRVPRNKIKATGIRLGDGFYAGFRDRTNETDPGTGLGEVCKGATPYPLTPRPGDTTHVNLNSCYSAFDPTDNGETNRKSVTETIDGVPGVTTVSGHTDVTLKQLRIIPTGNADHFDEAVAALESEALQKGFKRTIPQQPPAPPKEEGNFAQMANGMKASEMRSNLQDVLMLAGITDVTLVVDVVKTTPADAQSDDKSSSKDVFTPEFFMPGESQKLIWNPDLIGPVWIDLPEQDLEECIPIEIVPLGLTSVTPLGTSPATTGVSINLPMVEPPPPPPPVQGTMFFGLPDTLPLFGIGAELPDGSFELREPILAPEGLGAAFQSGEILVPLLLDVRCPSDLSGDGVTGVMDLLIILDTWGTSDGAGDITGDGIVNVADLLVVLDGWGQCQWPAALGACCTTARCFLTLEETCDIGGGLWQGGGSACETTDCDYDGLSAACCYYDEGGAIKCLITSIEECEGFGRPYAGFDSCGDVQCPEIMGACCVSGDSGDACSDSRTPEECAAMGGEFKGANTWCSDIVCGEPGGCCLDGACIMVIEEECIAGGGEWFGGQCDDVQCQEAGACCIGTACFDDATQDECAFVGGEWFEGIACLDEPCSGKSVANDDCTGAIEITVGLWDFDSTDATTGAPFDDFAACDHSDPVVYNDLWYSIDVVDPVFGILSTCGGASFDTRLAIYLGTCDGGLEMIACNDDAKHCPGGTSELFGDFPPGMVYIRIGGGSIDDRGPGMFRLELFGQ